MFNRGNPKKEYGKGDGKTMKVRNLIAIVLATLGIPLIVSGASASIITSAVDPALSGATLIDFNSEVAGAQSSRTFNGEVTFSVSSGTFQVGGSFNGSYGATGNSLYTPSGQDFTIDFTSAASAFGFSWGAADRSWTMALYDSSNTLIETLNIAAQTIPYIGFIGAANVGISSVQMSSDSGYDYILLDDFQYITSATTVPETSSLVFLGLGFGGLAARRFARRRKSV